MAEDREQGFGTARAGCREFEIALATYLEGEAAPSVRAHAQECAFCGAILSDLEAIRLGSRALPLEDPPDRMWANIRAQLAQEGGFQKPAVGWRSWFPFLGLLPNPVPVAALAMATVLGIFFMVHSRTFTPSKASNRAPTPAVEVAAAQVSAVDDNLLRQLEEMEKTYQAREKALDPALKAVYQKSLKSLDTSIDECRDSVRREPSNDLAHEYLLTAYAQKAEVLTSALQFEGR